MGAGGRRLVGALLLLAAAAALLAPAPRDDGQRSWADLIAPLAVGQAVARGYVLSPPRRGDAHDVVFVARRAAGPDWPAARVELHVVERGRWPGIAETRSFGVAWEVPRPGAAQVAPEADALAVRDALAAAIAAHDPGGLSVDAVSLTAEPPAPLVARILARGATPRGVLAAAAGTLALLQLAALPHGGGAVGALLFALGLALRLPALDLPFVHDQDVQRMFTGHSSWWQIATGVGLEDRHPPLYFFVLHVAQWFGQSEAAGRAPAALAGALAGPAVLVATRAMGRPLGIAAVLAALAVTISPTLIAASREVSEIPLYALLLVAAAAALVAALAAPRRPRLLAVAVAHGLALWTYYLAPFLVAAHAALLAARRADRRVALALAAGVALGAPALLLAAATLWRDWGARDVARAYPTLAWGQHTPLQLLAEMARIPVAAFGWPFAVLLLAATAVGLARRQLPVVTAALGAAATVLGIACLSPIARVQAYYAITVLPLTTLALAVVPDPRRAPARGAAWAAAALVAALSWAPLLAGARLLYLPDADAFMPRVAEIVARRPERTVVTVAHYDRTILAYYLARREGRSIDWFSVDASPRTRIEALVLVHGLDAGSEAAALARLAALRATEPILVVERDAFLLPGVADRLSACEPLLQAPTARLVACRDER